jgi:hypothetical protein
MTQKTYIVLVIVYLVILLMSIRHSLKCPDTSSWELLQLRLHGNFSDCYLEDLQKLP